MARGPAVKAVVPLDHLPLYAEEVSIAVAILGAKRAGEWSQIAALLEGRGLPKIDALMGGRYVPAVKAFFDKEHGLLGTAAVTGAKVVAV